MRPLILISLALAALAASAAEPAKSYPLWDGQETIAEYAKRVNLEPTKTLDLGNGVKLELVLIPAGKFVMGTEEPKPVDEEGFRSKILTGEVVLVVSVGALLILLTIVISESIRKRRRPQYSLAWFLVMTVAAGIGLLGGLHWYFSARAFAQAQSEYEAALARFKSSHGFEQPAHEVTLTKPYYVGKFEITQEQYHLIMGKNPSHFKGRDLPVETVLWSDAHEFCKKASEKTGSVVRLPTEAEWECACRAGTKTTYYTGDAETDLDRAGWYDKNSKLTTHPVGRKAPNAWGVHDMHGNALEWCADRFEADKPDSTAGPQGTAQDPGRVLRGGTLTAQGQRRVVRGGAWFLSSGECRSACRFGLSHAPFVGFRVVVEASKTQ